MTNFNQYFAIESKIKKTGFEVERSELIQQFTEGKKSGLRELTPFEYKEFLKWLQTAFNPDSNNANIYNTPENKMRRKIIAIFKHKMNYTMQGIDRWCMTYGKFKKRLQDHTKEELPVLVTQAEGVYQSYINSITK